MIRRDKFKEKTYIRKLHIDGFEVIDLMCFSRDDFSSCYFYYAKLKAGDSYIYIAREEAKSSNRPYEALTHNINNYIQSLSSDAPIHGRAEYINYQIELKIQFDNLAVYDLMNINLSDYTTAILKKYKSAIEFSRDIDNIDLSNLTERLEAYKI